MVSTRKDASAHLILLGRFAAVQDERALEIPNACRRLVALLAIHGLPMSRERVAGILWPDTTREKSISQVRTCLYRLGAIADLLITRSDDTLCIAPGVDVDYHLATALGRSLCDPDFVADESELHARPFEHELLPGWDEDWLTFEREAFRQLRFGALESIASQCLQRNRIEEAIQACLLVTRAEPLRESAHRLLARAHAAEGNPAQALQQLDHYAEILEREIGATPSRFTIDLRSQLSSAVEGDE
jgi:DNA-binding SARP family transcriptional activator